jgi:hypothetical protein
VNEGSLAAHPSDHASSLQLSQRLPHGAARNLELRGKLQLGREQISRLEPSRVDVVDQLLAEAFVLRLQSIGCSVGESCDG